MLQRWGREPREWGGLRAAGGDRESRGWAGAGPHSPARAGAQVVHGEARIGEDPGGARVAGRREARDAPVRGQLPGSDKGGTIVTVELEDEAVPGV